MAKNICVLGSTGSIGKQTLEIVDLFCDNFKVSGLSAGSNAELLISQAKKYKPAIVAIMDESKGLEVQRALRGDNIEVLTGIEGFSTLASLPETDQVVTAVSGCIGLVPTLKAIRAGKHIAIANKETLVAAGELVMAEAEFHGVQIIPVDSEHSAIFQCLERQSKAFSRIILTASGGPFRGKSIEELKCVSKESALKHPNWSMGAKITIDSATMVNKGLEVIEAKWLFGTDFESISVLIHPQSIVHSMVEYQDGSILAHLGCPDMRIPIQYALFYPERKANNLNKLDMVGKTLSFDEPDVKTFKGLRLAYEAGKRGGTAPAVFNAANEIAVGMFLQDRIAFLDIANLIDEVLDRHSVIDKPDLPQILAADSWSRELALRIAND